MWIGLGSFWRLFKEVLELVEDLKGSEVVIFKGDLNYRKLVGDVSFFLCLLFFFFVIDVNRDCVGCLGFYYFFYRSYWFFWFWFWV